MFRNPILSICILSLILWPISRPVAVVNAAEDGGLLSVEVLVPDESARVQRAAFKRGLHDVLIRLSGDDGVLSKLVVPPATPFVKQFHYEGVEQEPNAEGVEAIPQQKLIIRYDEGRVVDLLRENMLPVWSVQRDDLVIWLAVRDGFNHYLLRDSDESLMKAAADEIGAARGLPLIWPLYDHADRSGLRFADIWGGFERPILDASTRYAHGPVVAANLAWLGDRWGSEWVLLDSTRGQRWTFEHADYGSVIMAGLNQVANTLGTRYAVLEDLTQLSDSSHIRLELKGVRTVPDYQYAQNLLMSTPSVSGLSVVEMYADYVVFDVQIRTDERDLLNRLNRHRNLMQLIAARVDTGTAEVVESVTNEATPTVTDTPAREVVDRATYRYQLLTADQSEHSPVTP